MKCLPQSSPRSWLSIATFTAMVWIVASFHHGTSAFAFNGRHRIRSSTSDHRIDTVLRGDRSAIYASSSNNEPRRSTKTKKTGKKAVTLAQLRDQMLSNPAKYQLIESSQTAKKKKSGRRRTRQRVQNPQQTYMYAAQRREMRMEDGATSNTTAAVDTATAATASNEVWEQAREFGLVPSTQHCDPLDDDLEVPRVVGQIRVSDEAGSGEFAYVIEKPAGWAILGAKSGKPSVESDSDEDDDAASLKSQSKKKGAPQVTQLEIQEDDGSVELLEFSEDDILALLTPEEREEYLAESHDTGRIVVTPSALEQLEDEDDVDVDDFVIGADAFADVHDSAEGGISGQAEPSIETGQRKERDLSESTRDNFRRIEARAQRNNGRASFATAARPSVVAWLKEHKAAEGINIRSGKFWTALAGATDVDDSGLVLLCPRKSVDTLAADRIDFVAVMGTGGYVAPSSRRSKMQQISNDLVQIDLVSKLRKARLDDPIQTVKLSVSDAFASSSMLVDLCQQKFEDGIRGDAEANPFDRRARRRLMHCSSIAVGSLDFDDGGLYESDRLPDDIAVLSDRRNNHEFSHGSFLGRQSLRTNSHTNAYREINGAADGFPGWVVDRYDKWLLVQHDPDTPRGPIPSIHDGYTLGVYYIESELDRSSMGVAEERRPSLIEGKAAPDVFPVMENGVSYVVSLDKDLSTGLFLDQRPQRAWLKNNCSPGTHVLNCFAHTGAFSVAAAKAGASTVSLDLSQKWLDRLPEHFKANEIDFDESHDRIYGDCFDWLQRLAKRGEKYDIVIVDPPSTSVGGRKKKRWSVKNDMDELVCLASGLVKRGGLLWTTTNSASVHPIKFARLCKKGFADAGFENVRLERIQPMPTDFQSIEQPAVKNLVWRIN